MSLAVKRAIDLIGSGMGLVLISPILLVCSAAIALEDGFPLLFRQPRLGRGGRPFRIAKFRSMRVGVADLRGPDGASITPGSDDRVTACGAFMRRWSLDELPQLWNVLVGDMSLVGPRPEQADQIQYYTVEERRKLDMKPGMTGLAQVCGRNALRWRDRKRYDRWYVTHWTLGLDIWILLKTLPAVLDSTRIATGLGRTR